VSPRLPFPWLSEHDGDCSIQFRPIKKNNKCSVGSDIPPTRMIGMSGLENELSL